MKGYYTIYSIDETIEDAIKRFNYVGCVYPTGEQSYYICSNVPVELVEVECKDGSFFGDYKTAKEICNKRIVHLAESFK